MEIFTLGVDSGWRVINASPADCDKQNSGRRVIDTSPTDCDEQSICVGGKMNLALLTMDSEDQISFSLDIWMPNYDVESKSKWIKVYQMNFPHTFEYGDTLPNGDMIVCGMSKYPKEFFKFDGIELKEIPITGLPIYDHVSDAWEFVVLFYHEDNILTLSPLLNKEEINKVLSNAFSKMSPTTCCPRLFATVTCMSSQTNGAELISFDAKFVEMDHNTLLQVMVLFLNEGGSLVLLTMDSEDQISFSLDIWMPNYDVESKSKWIKVYQMNFPHTFEYGDTLPNGDMIVCGMSKYPKEFFKFDGIEFKKIPITGLPIYDHVSDAWEFVVLLYHEDNILTLSPLNKEE
ncbi:hypothetical protein Leryth_004002 [Lithospermum erythrorhizon]|nr:hypothetical protein Leryth_004002 [Lithospermum erythrorhizon]